MPSLRDKLLSNAELKEEIDKMRVIEEKKENKVESSKKEGKKKIKKW